MRRMAFIALLMLGAAGCQPLRKVDVAGVYRFTYHFGDVETLELRKSGVVLQRIYESQSDEALNKPYLVHLCRWELSGQKISFKDIMSITSSRWSSKLKEPTLINLSCYFEQTPEGDEIQWGVDDDVINYKRIK